MFSAVSYADYTTLRYMFCLLHSFVVELIYPVHFADLTDISSLATHGHWETDELKRIPDLIERSQNPYAKELSK